MGQIYFIISIRPAFLQLLLIFIILFILFLVVFLITKLLRPRYKVSYAKGSTYECGFEAFGDSRAAFESNFYTIGLLFLLLDVEVLFFVPWIFALPLLTFTGHISMFLFFVLLILGLAYEVVDGALKLRFLENKVKI